MKNVVRDWRFWVCALLFAGLFGAALYIEHIDQYHPLPQIWVLHAITIFFWLAGPYCRWSGRWEPGDGRVWGGWVLFSAVLLQLPMWGVSFVSRVLLGISLGMGVLLPDRLL